MAQELDAVAATRSRVKAALPRVVLEPIGKTSSDAKALAKSPDPAAMTQKVDDGAPVVRRRRDLNPSLVSATAISTSDAAVRGMVEAAEKVQSISADDDGCARGAG